jgi:hypothetical protein
VANLGYVSRLKMVYIQVDKLVRGSMEDKTIIIKFRNMKTMAATKIRNLIILITLGRKILEGEKD